MRVEEREDGSRVEWVYRDGRLFTKREIPRGEAKFVRAAVNAKRQVRTCRCCREEKSVQHFTTMDHRQHAWVEKRWCGECRTAQRKRNSDRLKADR